MKLWIGNNFNDDKKLAGRRAGRQAGRQVDRQTGRKD